VSFGDLIISKAKNKRLHYLPRNRANDLTQSERIDVLYRISVLEQPMIKISDQLNYNYSSVRSLW